MKSLPIVVLVLIQPVFAGDSFGEKFAELRKAGDTAETRKFLDQAAETESDNPDYYATAGAWWWQASRQVSITTKPSEEGEMSLRDPQSGEEVGSISTAGKVNPELTAKAAGILKEGVRRFPARADIVLGLAHVQNESGMADKCVETLLGLLATAAKDPAALKWTNDGPLPGAVTGFLPEAIQGYTSALYQAGTPEADALCAKLCGAVTATFPDHPFAYNIQAALADAQGRPAEALRLLEIAGRKAPDDALVLLNLGDARRKAGDKDKALEAYRKVLRLEVDEELKQQATSAIRDTEDGATAPPAPADKPAGP